VLLFCRKRKNEHNDDIPIFFDDLLVVLVDS
jgi:hypothetical protein